MLIQIPHFSDWINPDLIAHIEVGGTEEVHDGFNSGCVTVSIGTDMIQATFGTENEATVAAKEIAECINKASTMGNFKLSPNSGGVMLLNDGEATVEC